MEIETFIQLKSFIFRSYDIYALSHRITGRFLLKALQKEKKLLFHVLRVSNEKNLLLSSNLLSLLKRIENLNYFISSINFERKLPKFRSSRHFEYLPVALLKMKKLNSPSKILRSLVPYFCEILLKNGENYPAKCKLPTSVIQ